MLPDGTIAEWSHDLPPKDAWHRHLSHLAALYPLGQIAQERTPALADAARETIRRRLEPYESWEDTGWARSMLLLYAARLGDGEKAYWHLHEMMARLQNESGKIMHPSTRGASSFAPVWELDGNTGAAMGIMEMLLQSHGGVIRLLPALPEQWESGAYRDFAARGGCRVSAAWSGGRLETVLLRAEGSGPVRLRYGDTEQEILPEAGKPLRLRWKEGRFLYEE